MRTGAEPWALRQQQFFNCRLQQGILGPSGCKMAAARGAPERAATQSASNAASQWRIGISLAGLRRESRGSPAEREVNRQADDQPDEESYPRFKRQTEHQQQTEDDRQSRHKRDQRHAKTAASFRLASAQRDHAGRDDDEGEQRADVREVGERADVPDAGGNADGQSRDPGADVRSL